jgi:hypothetical protein
MDETIIFSEIAALENALQQKIDAIRILIRKHRKAMTAADVKFGLEILGFDLQRFKNPASAVHNTLIRMTKTDELVYDAANNVYRLFAMRRPLRAI